MYISQMLHAIRSRYIREAVERLDKSIKLWVGDAMYVDEKVEVLVAQLKGTCGLYKKHLAQIWCVAYLPQDVRQR